MRSGAVGLGVLVAASASAGIEHTILHGVSVCRVKAVVSAGQVPGLTDASLQTAAESSLKRAGVQVGSGNGADLFVGATVVIGPSGDCVVYIDARLIEDAKLDRNGLRVEAASWSGGSIIAGTRQNCGRLTTNAARKVVDDFVEHYRAMNPALAIK